MKPTEYTVFQSRAGDRNDLAIPGAKAIGQALARRTGVSPTVIGSPAPALNVNWREELDAALPALRAMQSRMHDVLASGAISIAATSRCAVSLATLPAVAQHHPAACVVWFDSHGDLNTPGSTTTGYLGGLALAAPAGLWDSGLGSGLGLDRIVLVGQRDLDPFEQSVIGEHGMAHIGPAADLASELRDAVAGRPVYVHLDCDVLDPGIVPTDYVHEGGLSLEDLRLCCTVLARHEFVGIEIAEFQYAWQTDGDPVSPEFLLDAVAPLLEP
ncbi:arginase family protein [Aureimonas leprariae]|nr:arginase family protein [Aureimonas leprariae]